MVHSAELTDDAARRGRTVPPRADTCKRDHPRTEGRCPVCTAASNRRSGERRLERQRQVRLSG